MKTAARPLFALALFMLAAITPAPAQAQAQAADEALIGQWQLTLIGEDNPADGTAMTLIFTQDTLTINLVVGGERTSWTVGYKAEDGQLTLEPAQESGQSTDSPYRIEEGRLIIEINGASAPPHTFERTGD